jgi:hypothetical protein
MGDFQRKFMDVDYDKKTVMNSVNVSVIHKPSF